MKLYSIISLCKQELTHCCRQGILYLRKTDHWAIRRWSVDGHEPPCCMISLSMSLNSVIRYTDLCFCTLIALNYLFFFSSRMHVFFIDKQFLPATCVYWSWGLNKSRSLPFSLPAAVPFPSEPPWDWLLVPAAPFVFHSVAPVYTSSHIHTGVRILYDFLQQILELTLTRLQSFSRPSSTSALFLSILSFCSCSSFCLISSFSLSKCVLIIYATKTKTQPLCLILVSVTLLL